MEDAGDVGRRDDDGKGLLAILHPRLKGLVVKPGLVPALLDVVKFVGLGKLGLFRFLVGVVGHLVVNIG